MAVPVVDFLEAVKIKDDESKGMTVAARAIQFFFESLAEQPAIIEACKRIRDRTELESLQILVFDQNGNTESARAGEDIHQSGLEGERTADLFAELATLGEGFIPELEALRFGKIEMGDDFEVTLKELPARRKIHTLERVG